MTSTQVSGLGRADLESYGPVARRFFERAKAERVPLAGGIELTHRCNLACVHCYVNLPAGDHGARQREMTTDEVKQVIDQLVRAGTMKLTLTGGEPLLRSDFEEIYRYAHGRGLLVVVYSNATLITRRIADLWTERPPAKVEVTQYGASRDTYNTVVDTAGDPHRLFERGMRYLRERGIRYSLKTIAMRSNVHELVDIQRGAQDQGVEFRFDTIISPRIDGGKKPLAERLPPTEAARLDVELKRASVEQWADYCSEALADPTPDVRYHCGAGLATFVIDPYGRLHVCELSRKPGWNVLEDGFENGWYGEIPRLRAQPAVQTGCTGCGAANVCNNCTGMRELEGQGANPYLCAHIDERNRITLGDDRPVPNGLVQLRTRRAS